MTEIGIFKKDISGNDIILVVPPPFFTKMPPLGVAYLVTYLKNKGFRADVLDFSLLLHNEVPEDMRRFWGVECTNSYFLTEIADVIFERFGGAMSDFVNYILSSDVEIVAFSVNQMSIFLSNKLAQMIKSKDATRKIIFGGPGTFFKHPRELIQPGFVDYFVIGEGEAALFSLVDRIKKGKTIGNEPGILPGKELGRCFPKPTVPIDNLDTVPFPTYEEFDLSAYSLGIDYKPLPLLSSRGCINKCSYCIDYIMWPKYRSRSAGHIFKEIEYHCRVNKTRAFEWNDLLCNGNLRELEALCDLIIQSGLQFNWVSYAVIRPDMTPGLFLKMKKAGCHTIIYGMEHSSAKVLKDMNKRYNAEEAEAVIRLTHEAGICTNVNVIVGFPGESEADLDMLAAFLIRNKAFIDEVTNISGFTLFPEAAVGVERRRFGISWQEGTDPMIFRDASGLDRKGRLDRVARFSKIVEDMGFRRNIINRPELNPLVKE